MFWRFAHCTASTVVLPPPGGEDDAKGHFFFLFSLQVRGARRTRIKARVKALATLSPPLRHRRGLGLCRFSDHRNKNEASTQNGG